MIEAALHYSGPSLARRNFHSAPTMSPGPVLIVGFTTYETPILIDYMVDKNGCLGAIVFHQVRNPGATQTAS